MKTTQRTVEAPDKDLLTGLEVLLYCGISTPEWEGEGHPDPGDVALAGLIEQGLLPPPIRFPVGEEGQERWYWMDVVCLMHLLGARCRQPKRMDLD